MLISSKLVSVKPLGKPSSSLFYLDFIDQNHLPPEKKLILYIKPNRMNPEVNHKKNTITDDMIDNLVAMMNGSYDDMKIARDIIIRSNVDHNYRTVLRQVVGSVNSKWEVHFDGAGNRRLVPKI